jgi:transposase
MSQPLSPSITIGVDTHKASHAAVAITDLGACLGSTTITATAKGYRDLEAWAKSLGCINAFGIEGTGSYGAGLARFLCEQGYAVLEVSRPNRQLRHQHGKTDYLDAEGAARAVLGAQASALPKSGTSTVEMIRHFKIARDTAVKARTQAMLTLKAIIVSVPAALREQLDALSGKMALLRHLAALRPGHVVTTTTSAKTSLRAIARRWLALDEEIKAHDVHLEQLTQQCAPALVEAHGIKANTAAEMLLLVGDNPERIHSEAALAKLCGACPIPASSGKTSRHRLNRGGHRQANAALRLCRRRRAGNPP